MRRAPPFTGRASIGGVRSSRRPSACVSANNHLQDHTGARKSSGRDPPWHLPLQPASRRSRRLSFVRADSAFATDGSVRPFARAYLAIGGSESQLSVQSSRQRRRKADTSFGPRRVCDVIRTAIGILANHSVSFGGGGTPLSLICSCAESANVRTSARIHVRAGGRLRRSEHTRDRLVRVRANAGE